MGILDAVVKNFEEDNAVSKISGKHTVAAFNKDMNTIIHVLLQEKALQYSPGRSYPSFPNVVRNPMNSINHEGLMSWMYMQLNNIIHGF